MIKLEVLKACRHLLAPIVRLLIRNGVPWSEFAELGKEVYVDVARRDYGLQGRPTNSARVALMTGLSRREVARVKNVLTGRAAPAAAPQDRISRILTAWHVDPAFCEPDGTPSALAASGDGRSIEALFKRYAGDTPHGALLKELTNLKLVVVNDGHYRVTSRNYVLGRSDPAMIRQAGIELHDHATTIVHNADAERTSPPRFDRMASVARFPVADVEEFEALVAEHGQAFLEAMDRWLAEHEAHEEHTADAKSRTVRIGVGVYLIHDESHGKTDDE